MMGLDEVLCAVADLAMPRQCLVCGEQLLLRERHICTRCLCDFPYTFNWSMSRNQMADRFNELIQRELESGPAFEPYAYAAALFLYRSGNGYSRITQSLKYHSNLPAGRYFARILGEKLSCSPLYGDVDLVVPVPLHWTRRWSRGYNQAEVIGKALAASLDVRLAPDLLVRRRRTRSQAHLDIFQKARNVSGAFQVKEKYLDSKLLSQAHHILLTDDVFTTGATMHACWSTLRPHTSARISVATLACVGY